MWYKRNFTVVLFLLLLATFIIKPAWASEPKFVFFFLGDGMSNSQIQATEAYLTTINGGSAEKAEDLLKPQNRLNMTQMPVQGMQTTYDAFALMTDSASSATAFASGVKTLSAVIGMDSTRAISYKSVAQLAHERGKKVGVLSSVSLNHATPAAYYASVANRGLVNSIATQMANSGYEFFGGGGLVSPEGPGRAGDTDNNVWDLLSTNGYTVLNDRDSIMALKSQPQDKVVAINPSLDGSQAMPYAIDKHQYPNNLTLAEMTEVAIANLYNTENGFFIMVEGGKIDWACHANDALATIGDTLDFDAAVGKALAFYEQHPTQTLIIVTGDHETGGMTVGHATTGYKAYYERLLGQSVSYEYFQENQWKAYKEKYAQTCTTSDYLAAAYEIVDLMKTAFGLNWAELSDYQQERIGEAWLKSLCGYDRTSARNMHKYGYYEPVIVTLTHVLNERASIGWTSFMHTGVPVPLYAKGQEADRFAGFYDNTDIAKRLAAILGVAAELPIVK